MHYAAFEGHVDVTTLLLDRQADIEAREESSSNTALHVAAVEGHTEVIQVLIERRADMEAKDVVCGGIICMCVNMRVCAFLSRMIVFVYNVGGSHAFARRSSK